MTLVATVSLGTRAVVRPITDRQAYLDCAHCGKSVAWRGRYHGLGTQQVVANIYSGDRWDHLEVFHFPFCYEAAGEPYGPAQ